ncbi:MAG: alpha/beta fold hydrolase [Cyclobacteriaceae bacterium]|nr:alpha/beta fold hydrolase [Cyclobacteriaceae bacterium]
MLITNSSYKKPGWPNGEHLETIIPSLFRRVKVSPSSQEQINTPDDDFLDLDWYKVDSDKLIIVSHGLEGSSESQYATGIAKYFNSKGIDAICWNYRGCSGKMNKQLRFYHSGATDDLEVIIKHAITTGYTNIGLVGFSLGGNVTLKFLGEAPKKYNEIKTAAVFSVPLHLSSGCDEISRPKNKIYANRFLRKLKYKIREKHKIMPDKLPLNGLQSVNTLRDFDDMYTGPLHGFENAEDYYQKSSAIFFLDKISVPTLLVNALNDPFLPDLCYPFEQLKEHTYVYFEAPDHGGHVGFRPAAADGSFWSERRAYEFIAERL